MTSNLRGNKSLCRDYEFCELKFFKEAFRDRGFFEGYKLIFGECGDEKIGNPNRSEEKDHMMLTSFTRQYVIIACRELWILL